MGWKGLDRVGVEYGDPVWTQRGNGEGRGGVREVQGPEAGS